MAEALPHDRPRTLHALPTPTSGARPRPGLASLRALIEATGTAPTVHPGAGPVPVLEPLQPLLPAAALERGTVVSVAAMPAGPAPIPSTDYLTVALLTGASAGGAWCAAVGLPDLGIAAAAALGADLSRILLVDHPADRWDQVVSVLSDGADLIALRPPGRPTADQLRRVGARLRPSTRRRGATLVVCGPWPGAHLTLEATDVRWHGIGAGTGHLTGREVTISASGRGGAGRTRSARLWLPAPDGAVQTAGAAETARPRRYLRPA